MQDSLTAGRPFRLLLRAYSLGLSLTHKAFTFIMLRISSSSTAATDDPPSGLAGTLEGQGGKVQSLAGSLDTETKGSSLQTNTSAAQKTCSSSSLSGAGLGGKIGSPSSASSPTAPTRGRGGLVIGADVGADVGEDTGEVVTSSLTSVGADVGEVVGEDVGPFVGEAEGASVAGSGASVGEVVGDFVDGPDEGT